MAHKLVKSERRASDARVLRTRDALRAALVTLLERHDLPTVTVQMIVAEAGVGYATFFRHHPGVKALLIDLADTLVADCIAALMPAIAAGDRSAMLRALVRFVAARRRTVHALLIGGGETVRREITRRAIERSAALPLGFDPAVPRALAIAHAVGAAMTVMGWWVSEDAAVADEAAIAELIERLALQPLSAPAPG